MLKVFEFKFFGIEFVNMQFKMIIYLINDRKNSFLYTNKYMDYAKVIIF